MTDPRCYAGLDVSMEETHLCVIDADGAIRAEGKVASTPDAIARALAATPGLACAVFETGRMAPMLYHGLRERGVPAICIESRQAHHTLKAIKANKSDRNDARGLAQLARTGFFKPTHVKSLSAHAVRALLAARKKLVGQRVTLENQIRGLAVVFGARLPRSLTPAFKAQALELAQGVPGLATAMRGLLDARDAVLTAVAAIDRDVRAMAKTSEACRLLTTVPGVGPITALAFAAAIDNPARFRRSREVGAYLGLTPRRYQSGETDYNGSITKQGDTRLRTLLYEAASVLLTRTKAEFALKDWARGVATRSSARKARVALARRLAVIMHAMLRDRTPFQAA